MIEEAPEPFFDKSIMGPREVPPDAKFLNLKREKDSNLIQQEQEVFLIELANWIKERRGIKIANLKNSELIDHLSDRKIVEIFSGWKDDEEIFEQELGIIKSRCEEIFSQKAA